MKKRGPGSGVRDPLRESRDGQDAGGADPGSRSPDAGPEGGRLYVVATPIGNLGDFSPRAADVLRSVDAVLAEDTRRVRKLLNHFGIPTPARSFHEHNEERETPRLLARLRSGDALALVSDAGTPLLADPGYRLVRACRGAAIPVIAVPGPSAVTAAVAVSGLPPYPFTFAGFLPAARGARQARLAELASFATTLVLFLSPHRLAGELADCAEHLGGEREAALLAELTKLHERHRGGPLTELAAWAAAARPRGEYTLVIGPPLATAVVDVDESSARRELERALAEGHPLAEARRVAAGRLGIPRRRLYDLLKGKRG